MTPRPSSPALALAAIVSGLATILTPIVASARQSAGSTTLGNLRRIVYAATQYAQDYDDCTVLTQQGDLGYARTWPVLLQPYLPGQEPYFDPTRPAVTTKKASLLGVNVPWSSVTTIGINDSGYSGKWNAMGGSCSGRRVSYQYGQRSLDAMFAPERRIAFAPTAYANTKLGWSFFRSYDASWTRANLAPGLFSWNNLVWGTRGLFDGGKVPFVRADGSAGTLGAGFFKTYSEASASLALAAYCNWMNTGDNGRPAWGRAWTND